MLNLRWIVIVLLAALAAWPAHARRLALVIGNDNYLQFTRLDKAGNDARSHRQGAGRGPGSRCRCAAT